MPFTPQEIEQHLSLYIFQGINPSPQLIMKTRSQSVEPVQGNDLIANVLSLCKFKQKDIFVISSAPFFMVEGNKFQSNTYIFFN